MYDRLDTVQETQGTTVNPILTGLGIDQRYARNDTSGRTYFLTDQLGSTRLLTNAAGSAVQRYDYDPYGTTTQSSAAYTNPYQYTGREKDASGLYYYRARYYRPQWGRFISEDPIQLFAGPNSYAYVGANPIGLIDPLGLWSLTLTGYIPTEILGPIGPGGGVVLTGIGLSINSISFRGGIGAGAGISFNPFGTPPDSNHMDAPCGNKSGIGVYVDGSAGVGIFGAGTGWNYGGTQSVGPDGRPRWQEYGGFSSAPTLDATIGSGAQVGAGIEVTKYF
ncbi:RHS repeat-associated core domain-containing protein [Xanthomonas hortorum]|uniref:RHS repeat-associated core domain-containing protein n=1 Tax=Xanthomonas hortorum TaxID=56454 RepID=UPI001F254CB4|nr:RHS repeat-associated core domain-containing protein [Xanthomonas hortorum]